MMFEFSEYVVDREVHHLRPEDVVIERGKTQLVEAQHRRRETERPAETVTLQEEDDPMSGGEVVPGPWQNVQLRDADGDSVLSVGGAS